MSATKEYYELNPAYDEMFAVYGVAKSPTFRCGTPELIGLKSQGH